MQQINWKSIFKSPQQQDDRQIAVRVSVVGVAVNLILTLFKLIAGIVASSAAMLSDAVHSASDVFSTIIVIIGVNISAKESDTEHPYGHERIEAVAAMLLSVVLFATGAMIGVGGIRSILIGSATALEAPGVLATVAAVVSIAVKEWMYWYTRAAAKKVNSTALMASAWHHRSDAFSSVGALIGIAGAQLGYRILDPIASLVICVFIIKAAYDIFMDAVNKLVDRACDEETEQRMREVILSQKGILGIDMLDTRLFGSKIYVDTEIRAAGDLSLNESHQIAEAVHESIEKEFGTVKHCMVHVNPDNSVKDEN